MADGFEVNNFAHLASQSDVSYGIYDTQDECWIGDDAGPRVFTRADSIEMNGMPQETIAKLAAQMAGVQLGYVPGRLQPREFHEKELHLRDEIPTKMSAIEALTKLESGKL